MLCPPPPSHCYHVEVRAAARAEPLRHATTRTTAGVTLAAPGFLFPPVAKSMCARPPSRVGKKWTKRDDSNDNSSKRKQTKKKVKQPQNSCQVESCHYYRILAAAARAREGIARWWWAAGGKRLGTKGKLLPFFCHVSVERERERNDGHGKKKTHHDPDALCLDSVNGTFFCVLRNEKCHKCARARRGSGKSNTQHTPANSSGVRHKDKTYQVITRNAKMWVQV